MIFIEIVAVITGILSSLLTINRNYFCWVIGLLNIILYTYIFYTQHMYANVWLQVVFINQSLYGLFKWINNAGENHSIVITRYKYDFKNVLLFILLFIFINLILSFIFTSKLDYITSSLSVVAMYLLSIGKIENWIFWMVADILYVIMFLQSGMILSALLFFIFFVLCIVGYLKWLKLLTIPFFKIKIKFPIRNEGT